jgi:hypothetical protein
MVRDGTEATNANTKTYKDADGTSSPLSATLANNATPMSSITSESVCRPEHAFHAFDALYCALMPHARPIKPLFPDDK